MQQQLHGVSILLVEDNPEGREVLETVLTLAGANVRTASNAEEALELLRRSVPAVIITDIKMPGHSGFWLLDQVRALPLPSAVPVIAYTGHVSRSDSQQLRAAGFDAHLAKPAELDEIEQMVLAFARWRPRSG